jgi:hypothetical protein
MIGYDWVFLDIVGVDKSCHVAFGSISSIESWRSKPRCVRLLSHEDVAKEHITV